jgi:phage repressor protein C with HTH and peptisase S24 domain
MDRNAVLERDTYAAWVREGLRKEGKTQAGLALALGVDQSAVSRMASGRRLVKAHEIALIADFLEEPPPARAVAIRGYVGAGQQIFAISEDHDPFDFTEAPPSARHEVAAAIVRGDSMYPVYQERDVLYYGEPEAPSVEHLGRRVVVRLTDGRTLIKVLRRGSQHGLYNLESFNAPTLEDKAVEWVARISWVKPAG